MRQDAELLRPWVAQSSKYDPKSPAMIIVCNNACQRATGYGQSGTAYLIQNQQRAPKMTRRGLSVVHGDDRRESAHSESCNEATDEQLRSRILRCRLDGNTDREQSTPEYDRSVWGSGGSAISSAMAFSRLAHPFLPRRSAVKACGKQQGQNDSPAMLGIGLTCPIAPKNVPAESNAVISA